MAAFTLGRKTIINEGALEYDWVRQLVSEGTEKENAISSIQKCFGGDEETALIFYKIAVGDCSPGVLLTHLSITDWQDCDVYMEARRYDNVQ
ncbi:hypothetical protein [Enterovibrio baiacu]|uniref:hypothetical protein n=1 Tax=Enterovibrio baiacu TaxID=2491023 RepID=UPI001010DF16|nr:hypothetical protein [Enterovibrio baiacu]MBE1273398.1 hypothetical protein [Enterovibrio baiacu]